MRAIIMLPVLLLLVLFALSNTAPVQLGIWPTDWSIELPAAVAILGASAVAFIAGALLVWLGEQGRRRQHRRARQHITRLESQLRERPPEPARVPVQAALGPPE